MKKIYSILVLLFFYANVQGQVLKGIVQDRVGQKPIPNATLFLSNTMVSATTLDDGSFHFPYIPTGRYELIISCTGYKTSRVELISSSLPQNLIIQLEPYIKELNEVVVKNYEKDGWNKWGRIFTEQFIGTTPFSVDVQIENPDAVKFILDKQANTLSAFSNEPLIIINKALGYELYYELELFEFNFRTKLLLFKGFPLFKKMTPRSKSQERRWTNNRKEAYQGSMLHFFRSLYRNQLLENGFEVRSLIEVTNEEKMRVKNFLSSRVKSNKNKELPEPTIRDTFRFSISGDSMSHYQQVMRMPDNSYIIQPQILTGDSIAFGIDSFSVGMFFKNSLQVKFIKKKMPIEVANALSGTNFFPASTLSGYDRVDENSIIFANKMDMISRLKLTSDDGILVLSNGSFFDATRLISYGYWAFWERISTLLPLDYKPPPQ